MQSLTLIELLKQVITSWQVIAITVALLLYLNLVFYVSRSHNRPKKISKISVKKSSPKPAEHDDEVEVTNDKKADNTNDELGLEEE